MRTIVERRYLESPGWVFLAFTAIAVGMTWPLAAHPLSSLPGGYRDVWQNLWNFWWWKTALIDLHQSPYVTDRIFFPAGADLAFHTHSPANQILFLPVSLVAGPAAAYVAAILSSFALAGLGAYLLGREITGRGAAGFVAGTVFAFFPWHQEQAVEHVNLASIQFLPLAALFAIRLGRSGGERNALLLGLFLALAALADWQYGLFALGLAPVLFLAEVAAHRHRGEPQPRHLVRHVVLAAAVVLVLIAPFVWPLLRAMAAGEPYAKQFLADRGIDPLFLFVPPPGHLLLGRWSAMLHHAHRGYETAGFIAYVGVVPLALTLVALVRARRARRTLLWAMIGVVSLLLALGATPRLFGASIETPFPHAIFAYLPVLRALRVANRFFAITMLAVSVLCAIGAAALPDRRRGAEALAVVALVLVDYRTPFPVQRYQPATIPGDAARPGAVLDLPFSDGFPKCPQNQAAQVAHGRPIAGGYVSVTPRAARRALHADPVLGALVLPEPGIPEGLDFAAHLRKLGFTMVILHSDRIREDIAPGSHRAEVARRCALPRASFEALSAALAEATGPPVADDERRRVFRLR